MTISDQPGKANWMQEEYKIRRYNHILKGINEVFSQVVQAKTEKELGNACLSLALELTSSQIGFVGEVDTDGLVNYIAVNGLGQNQCLIFDKTGHCRLLGDFIVRGLYECIIKNAKGLLINDLQSHPDSIVLPPGHPQLTSFLGVPLAQNGKTMGILGVANREGGYSCEQQEDLEAIAPAVTQALQRKKAEEALCKAYEKLQMQSEQLQAQLKELHKAYESLHESENKLKETLDSLEQKVKERTVELEEVYKSLKESENGLAAAQKMAHIGNWDWDIINNKLYLSDEVYRIYGFKPQELKITRNAFISYVHPEDRDYVDNSFSKLLNEKPINMDYRILLANEEIRIIHAQGEIIYNEVNVPVRTRGILQDITDRKQMEEALRHSENKYRNIIETANEGIWVSDAEDIITYVNNKMVEMLGYSLEETIGRSWWDFTDEECKAVIKSKIDKRLQGINERYELRLIRKDSSPFWVLVSSKSLFDKDGKYTGSLSMLTDLTQRKKVESELKETLDKLEELVKQRTSQLEKAYISLKESEIGLAEAQKMANLGSWDWNLVTDDVRWSDEIYHIFGCNPQEFGATYDELLNYIHPDDRDYVNKTIEKAISGESYNIVYRIVLANGEERTVHMQSKVIFDEENIPIRVKGIIQNITERKKSEEKIKILLNAVESSDDAIVTMSPDAIVTSWNKGAEKIYGYSAEEILGKNLSILEPESLKGEIKGLTEKIKKGTKIKHYETSQLKKDDAVINISVTLSPVIDTSGELVAISAIARDITERIKAEENLVNIETYRKKEIHHRIKNNLQVISSLLDLQAEKFNNRKCIKDCNGKCIRNSEVLEAFRESQDRVISMALIHEELHKGGEFEMLNFSAYTEKLVDKLFLTYRLGHININLIRDLEENLFFDMDTAIPLGMVVNELVSNSFKHAFPGKSKGEIRIKLGRKKTGECTNSIENKSEGCKNTSFILTVSDNGIGIPENLEIEDLDSLGFQLVVSLVNQLDGEFELKRKNGTEFTMRFTVKDKINKYQLT